jgi:membrane dipeptidase
VSGLWTAWVACSAPPAPPADPPPPEPPPAAWRADLHVDTLTELADRSVGFDDPQLEAGLPALEAGQTNVIVEVLWPPREGDHEAYTSAMVERFERELAKVSGRMSLVRSPAEADQAIREGRTAALLALEGAHGIEVSGEEGLRRLHARGLSMLGLAWSLSNRFAGSSGDGGGGLTADGRALMAEAERLGVLVDVSHSSRQTTLDVCAVATRPLVASHSGVRALMDVPRNLSPEELRCIAATGGVIGVNFHAPFLAPGEPGVAQVADHIHAIVAAVGIEHVAIGSDWDGDITVPRGLESARGLPALWEELARRGYTAEELALVRGGNFRRVWSEALRPQSP